MTPLFIVGLARTGTTLIQSLLDGHPQLLVDVYDSRFFSHYLPISRPWMNIEQRIELAEREMISFIFNEPSRYYQDFLSYISIEDLKAQFRESIYKSKRQASDFLNAYMYAIGVTSGWLTNRTKYWVAKSPSMNLYMKKRIVWWPNAKYIHVVRDPRDVYASIKSRDIRNHRKITPIDAFSYSWAKSASQYREYQQRLGEDRYFLLRYEDLIGNLHRVLADLVEFLEIEHCEILTSPTKGQGKVLWGGNPASGQKQSGVYSSSHGQWLSYLSNEEVKCIESMLFSEMKAFDYELVTDVSELPKHNVMKIRNIMREVRLNLFHPFEA